MISKPASHQFAALYFGIMSFVFGLSTLTAVQKDGSVWIGQATLLVPHLVALWAILRIRFKWVYFFCALLLFTFPAFIAGSYLFLLIRVSSAKFSQLAPGFVASAFLLWLFAAFTFGSSSRARFGFSTKPTAGSIHEVS